MGSKEAPKGRPRSYSEAALHQHQIALESGQTMNNGYEILCFSSQPPRFS